MPQELSCLQIIAGLDTAVKAAVVAARTIVLLIRVPAGVSLVGALVRARDRRDVGTLRGQDGRQRLGGGTHRRRGRGPGSGGRRRARGRIALHDRRRRGGLRHGAELVSG